jgi:uncharacterized membrane protein
MRIRLPGLYILLALVLAGLIHVVAVLALPELAPKSGYGRLASLGPANTMIQIPPAAPGRQVLPMMGPDVRYAFCRFDLADGPVRLNAKVANELLLIALYTPEGENFYSVVAPDMKRPEIDLIIITGDQAVAEAGVDAPESSENVIVVNSPVRDGIALLRMTMNGPSRASHVERTLAAASCGRYTRSG